MRRRLVLGAGGIVAVLGLAVVAGNDALRLLQDGRPSTSTGTTARGTLRQGKRLPTSGPNFRSYSRLGALLGRTSVHSTVRTVVLAAYADLAHSHPELTFVLGETGWPSGGPFRPHRTHQNGLSVDFMVPVRNGRGAPVALPTWPWTRFGYDLQFSATGTLDELRIDFEAIALHLAALDREARAHGTGIARLIIAPEFQPLLWATPTGRTLRGRFPVMTTRAWVRHDEHYHVDFETPRN